MKIQLNQCALTNWKTSYQTSLAYHANNPKIAKYLRDVFPSPYSQADALSWIQLNQSTSLPQHLAITVDNQCVGSVGITIQADIHRCNAEIGYWLGEDYWGKGIITEAVQAMVEYAFENFDIVRIYAGVIDGNKGSEKVLKKAGFHLEYSIPFGVIKNHQLYDEHIYAILKKR